MYNTLIKNHEYIYEKKNKDMGPRGSQNTTDVLDMIFALFYNLHIDLFSA